MVTIENSERLSYRLLTPDDGELLFQLDQDPEVLRYINGGKVTSRTDVDDIFIPRMQSYTNSAKGWGLWKVTIIESNEFIGWVLVRPNKFFSDKPNFLNLELGWRFMQKSWGKGYATEAALAVKNALIEQTDIEHLCAIAMPDNAASVSVMKKLGMTFVESFVHKDPLGDLDAVYYQMDV